MTPSPLAPSFRRRVFFSTLGVLGVVVALSLAGCGVREAAPESTFVLIDGSKATTSDMRGKVTLVNFWATTCVSCVKEMPALIATYNKYQPQGFDTLAVAMEYDPPAWVLNFAQTRQLPFKVALDSTGEIAKAWGDVKLTPTTYLVDKQGRIVKRYVGEPDMEALHRLIEDLLAQT
jgi:peroxiredoxin